VHALFKMIGPGSLARKRAFLAPETGKGGLRGGAFEKRRVFMMRLREKTTRSREKEGRARSSKIKRLKD
jgi:hypothetical protein